MTPAVRTLAYGPGPDQVGDLRVPAGEGEHPVVVLIHGGFWRHGYDRSLMDGIADALAERGWASWNVEYRRGPGSGLGAVGDVQAAIAALDEIEVAGVDGRRRVVVGHSAGGHLALATGGQADAELIISLAGVAALALAAREGFGNGAAVEFMGATPASAPDDYRAADPIEQLPLRAPVLLVHGDQDDRVPLDQSRRYADAARVAGGACELLELPGEGHFGVIDPTAAAFAAWADRLPAIA